MGLITNDNDAVYRVEVSRFVEYCENNFLILNVQKTKELIIDFRTSKRCDPEHTVINGSVVDRAHEYKYTITNYLGLIMSTLS